MSEPYELERNGATERCRQLEADVSRLRNEMDHARQDNADLLSRNQQLEREKARLETYYQQCRDVLLEKTGIEFFGITREEMEEMENSGLNLDQVIQELEKQLGG